MTKELKRNYSMSDGNLRQLAVNFKLFATRDLAALDKYNITASTVTALNALSDAFDALPLDAELRAELKNATIAKNNKRKEIEAMLENVHNRAKMAFEPFSPEYKEFEFEGFDNISDEAFGTRAKTIARAGLRHLTVLAERNQTAAELNDIISEKNEFENLIGEISLAISNRAKAANNRIIAGNALYEAIGDIAIAGKAVFEETDSAKFNDYLLYPGANVPQTPTAAPSGVGYATPYFYWNETPNATSYGVEVSHDGGATWELVEENIEDPQYAVEYPTIGSVMYRVYANNAAGQSERSTPITLTASASSPAGVIYNGTGFHITPVDNAEEYHFKYGPVGGSVDDPGTTEVFIQSSPDYGWTFPFTGTWVIYVRAKVGGVWSPWLVTEMTFA